MLKNIELFDKLVSRFHGRILFLKDIIGEDICVWSFFGNKRKLSEICCTSIVYATEKKQTKGTGFIMNDVFCLDAVQTGSCLFFGNRKLKTSEPEVEKYLIGKPVGSNL